ncbi:MAG: hypothetical protein QW228_03475 [Candidatus Aenigmatarchaeota archaeon]
MFPEIMILTKDRKVEEFVEEVTQKMLSLYPPEVIQDFIVVYVPTLLMSNIPQSYGNKTFGQILEFYTDLIAFTLGGDVKQASEIRFENEERKVEFDTDKMVQLYRIFETSYNQKFNSFDLRVLAALRLMSERFKCYEKLPEAIRFFAFLLLDEINTKNLGTFHQKGSES